MHLPGADGPDKNFSATPPKCEDDKNQAPACRFSDSPETLLAAMRIGRYHRIAVIKQAFDLGNRNAVFAAMSEIARVPFKAPWFYHLHIHLDMYFAKP